MPSMSRLFFGLGGLSAMLSVLIGAFGAHALRARLTPELLAVYHTGTQYQFYHSLGLLIIALLIAHFPERGGFVCAGWVMVAGIVLFSGSLYVLSLTGIRMFGAITPIGGVMFIVAWGLLTITALRTA
ncbi:MAG TPA: DUF423 domain-containing protein [Gemmatimonadaceae bacterium]|jgi:uncharacterized membrane protein YgdD (TMEM256/DUF423 family)|nr:DUF423 domain-containing protein [Gemmatimonadaceae bacterium]